MIKLISRIHYLLIDMKQEQFLIIQLNIILGKIKSQK
jgi:hypothetical protein